MIYQKGLKLNVGYLHNLRNEEFSALVTDVVSIANTFNIEDKMVSLLLERLIEDEKTLGKVVNASLKHKNTDLIDEYYDNMRKVMIAVKSSIKALHYFRNNEQKQAAWTLNNWISAVRHDMGSPTKIRALHAAGVLTTEYNNNEEVRKAVETAGLSVFYNEMEWLLNEIREMTSERLHTNVELSSLRNNLRERVTFNLDMLFGSLLAVVSLNGEDAPMYYTLCTRFEQALTSVVAIQKTRTTRNKKKREKESTDNTEMLNNAETTDNVATASSNAKTGSEKIGIRAENAEASSDNMSQNVINMSGATDVKLIPAKISANIFPDNSVSAVGGFHTELRMAEI